MKTVILPCNGNPSFFDKCRLVADIFNGKPVHYIFLDIRPVPDNYNDMITLARTGKVKGSFDNTFCAALKCFAEGIGESTVTIDHIYGDSVAVFRNYAEHRNADLVVFDQGQWAGHPHFRVQDIFRMLMRCGCELLYMSADTDWKTGSLRLKANASTVISAAPIDDDTYHHADGGREVVHVAAPASVKARYRSVDNLLNQLGSQVVNEQIFTCQLSKLSRYFMRLSSISQMLSASNRPFLWVKK